MSELFYNKDEKLKNIIERELNKPDMNNCQLELEKKETTKAKCFT
jgi:hypothetical protein